MLPESTDVLPVPPEEMRTLVGVTDVEHFDNPNGDNVIPETGERAFGAIFDFGCGCGRVARKLIQQVPQPRRYVGIDLHAGMIRWCQENLSPNAGQFEFIHHDVFNAGFNPQADDNAVLPFPVGDGEFDVVIAHSVFTHVLESAATHYLSESARILSPTGQLHATFFLFDKAGFPMMQSFQNALYINQYDPTNAVIFDREWLRTAAETAGLTITRVIPPTVRGFHWMLVFERAEYAGVACPIPEDLAPLGSVPPPISPVAPHRIGSD